MSGRGVFAYSGGLIPHRRPISILVGDPIDVGPADPNPTDVSIWSAAVEWLLIGLRCVAGACAKGARPVQAGCVAVVQSVQRHLRPKSRTDRICLSTHPPN